MKKFFLAVAALAMLATSCTKDETTVAGGESLVSFSIDSPELATRAYGDGTEAKVLYYAFYEINGEAQNLLTAISATGKVGAGEQPKTLENGKATINVHLVDGRQYAAIFWAQNANAPYTIDWEAQEMSYNPDVDLTANNEAYDAFYAYYPVTIEKTHKVTLTRPFAQINIATAQVDLDNAANAGLDADQTKVTVNAYKTLDLVNGDVKNPASFEFGWAAKAEGVAKTNYPMLAMNYVLVNERELVNVTMEVRKDASDTPITRTYSTVPVQRNYQTFILGNLLTTQNDFNVEVEEDFNQTILPETDLEKFIMDVQTVGGEFTLTKDIELPKTLVIRKDVVLNLNGNDITVNNDSAELEEGDAIIVMSGHLTINGEGTVTANTRAVWARGNGGAKVTINGGKFVGATKNFECEVIYASGNGQITINGGEFVAENEDQVSFAAPQHAILNLHGNGKTGCDIVVYGGTFHNFNPADNVSENPKKNFVAEGYKAVKDGDVYTVKVDGTLVSTAAELATALNDPSCDVIRLNAGEYGAIVMKSNKTIIGCPGAEVGAVNLNGAENVTLKNITFDAANAVMSYGGDNKERLLALIISRDATNCKTVNGAKNLVIDGCNFTGTFPGNGGCVTSFADQKHTGAHNVTIKDCIFDVANCGYAIYGFYTGSNEGNFVIVGNTFKSATYANTIYLGRYASNIPVVVSGNTFETKTSLGAAVYVQDHSNYGVSVDASNNTFAN